MSLILLEPPENKNRKVSLTKTLAPLSLPPPEFKKILPKIADKKIHFLKNKF